jgi:hypothetical protein
MKAKFYWVALLASAAMIAQANAGGHNSGGGGGGGGHASAGPARRGGGPSFRSGPARNFGGSRMIYSGQRFAPNGWRSSSPTVIRQHPMSSNAGTSLNTGRFTTADNNRADRFVRSPNRANQAALAQNHRANAGNQIRHGNNLPTNWHNHVVAQRSANWHRDWDRSRDHRWNGHHCRFINGSWVIFDYGFYPWWPYWYPYDYDGYAPGYYGYAPSYYESGSYDSDQEYNPNGYGSEDQSIDSTVAAAQEQLARQGFYRGEIDGVLGQETRQAIERYQTRHGLRVTGYLTNDTLQALGLPGLADN